MSPRPTVKAAHPPLGTPTRYPLATGYLPSTAPEGTMSVVPMGSRNQFAEQVKALVRQRGDEIREGLSSQETVQEYVEALRWGLRKRDRTCIHEYGRVMRLVDAEVTVIHEFIRSLAKDETELRAKVNAYDAAGEADSLTALERMTTAMEALLPLHEEHRAMIVRRLGGFMPSHTEGEVLG